MKKKILISLTVAAMTLSVFGQDRTTKTKAVIATETISQLTTATGWMLNPDEEWVSLKSTIPVSLAAEFNSLLDHEQKGLGTDNFKYYKLKELTYNASSYYVLIKQYRHGYYTYKSIKEGWNSLLSHTAYIFAKSELNKLDNIKDSQLNMIEGVRINKIQKIKKNLATQVKNQIGNPNEKSFKHLSNGKKRILEKLIKYTHPIGMDSDGIREFFLTHK